LCRVRPSRAFPVRVWNGQATTRSPRVSSPVALFPCRAVVNHSSGSVIPLLRPVLSGDQVRSNPGIGGCLAAADEPARFIHHYVGTRSSTVLVRSNDCRTLAASCRLLTIRHSHLQWGHCVSARRNWGNLPWTGVSLRSMRVFESLVGGPRARFGLASRRLQHSFERTNRSHSDRSRMRLRTAEMRVTYCPDDRRPYREPGAPAAPDYSSDVSRKGRRTYLRSHRPRRGPSTFPKDCKTGPRFEPR
jgi:hypothetical protein